MTDRQSLAEIVRNLLDRGGEGVYWDFKLKHHAHRSDLIHDVLCLANAEHDGPRFMVFGVEDANWSVRSVENDADRRTQADIASVFRDNAGKFFQSRFPTFHLHEVEIDGALLDVLVVEDEPKKPYYLIKRIGRVTPHHVYTRVCDTNTPVDDAAQPHEIERMWRERFGLDAPALERAKQCLREPRAWSLSDEDGNDVWHHDVFPEFTLRATSADGFEDCGQEWTRGEIRTDDNTAGWYELRYHQTLLKRIHFVSFDNHKKSIVAPDWEAIGRGRFYFYRDDSVEYAVQRFWTEYQRRDDSKGLRVRGDGTNANEARSRWRRGLDIPVVEPGELEGFTATQQGDSIRDPEPATDPHEQYQLFLRVQLDFDAWRRAHRRVWSTRGRRSPCTARDDFGGARDES